MKRVAKCSASLNLSYQVDLKNYNPISLIIGNVLINLVFSNDQQISCAWTLFKVALHY